MSFEDPETLRFFLIEGIRPLLPEGFDIDRHFNPTYRPWQQRIAVVPDGDFFTGRSPPGQASVVTDQIEEFTPSTASASASGDVLEADVDHHGHRLRPQRDGRRVVRRRRPSRRRGPTR